jgi:hypothetical protein
MDVPILDCPGWSDIWVHSFVLEEINDQMEKRTNGIATKEDLSHTKADLIKWMFLFWIAQVGTTFGFILLFLKK